MVCGALCRDWANLQQHLAHYDAQRETVIKRSRGESLPHKNGVTACLHRSCWQLKNLKFHASGEVVRHVAASELCYRPAHASCQLLYLLADGQKAAKQAIYSLHRGDFDRATQQLHAAGVSSPAASGGRRHKPRTLAWVRLMRSEQCLLNVRTQTQQRALAVLQQHNTATSDTVDTASNWHWGR